MIPKIVYSCWYGKTKKNSLVNKCEQSWRDILTDYKFTELNELNTKICADYPLMAYEKKAWAFVSDYMSLIHLYETGGIYLDCDVEVIKPFESILTKSGDGFFGFESNFDYIDFSVCNAVMGVIPRSKFVKDCLDYYDSCQELVMKPKVFHDVLHSYGVSSEKHQVVERYTLYPQDYFFPYNLEDGFSNDCITENTRTLHHWMGSWRYQLTKSEIAKLTQGGLKGEYEEPYDDKY